MNTIGYLCVIYSVETHDLDPAAADRVRALAARLDEILRARDAVRGGALADRFILSSEQPATVQITAFVDQHVKAFGLRYVSWFDTGSRDNEATVGHAIGEVGQLCRMQPNALPIAVVGSNIIGYHVVAGFAAQLGLPIDRVESPENGFGWCGHMHLVDFAAKSVVFV